MKFKHLGTLRGWRPLRTTLVKDHPYPNYGCCSEIEGRFYPGDMADVGVRFAAEESYFHHCPRPFPGGGQAGTQLLHTAWYALLDRYLVEEGPSRRQLKRRIQLKRRKPKRKR
jgi:hypothetical protein